jgi:hypothetical protein
MNKDVVGSLAWGVGIVVVALCGRHARELGYLEADTVTRIVIGLTGLMVAWFGNRMPKTFVPAAWARKVRRVGGWSMALSGLAYAALWAFAPLPVALAAGIGVIVLGIVVSVGYCFAVRCKADAA